MIEYCGVPLILDSPKDVLGDFLNRYQSLEDLRLFGAEPVASDNDLLPRNPGKQSYALMSQNWPTPPALRLNTLYWPCTGASRWAWFIGLIDEWELEIILKVLHVGASDPVNKYGFLRLSEGQSHYKNEINTPMYLLPPRRISSYTGGDKHGRLWLLPLVDERYLWQYIDVGDNTASAIGATDFTWATFLGPTKLGALAPFSAAGLDLDAISADYKKPDGIAFDARSYTFPAVLDAAAESIGMRVVRDFGGTVYLMNYSRSATRLQDSLKPAADLETGYDLIAGGKADKYQALRVPTKVTVVFPKWTNNGQYYTVDRTAAVVLGADTLTHGGTKVLYTSAQAEFDSSNAISNGTACTALANKIALDWYNWQTEVYDYTFQGLKKWKPQGYDDCILYAFGNRRPETGEYDAQTRIVSLPMNFGVGAQLQSFKYSASRGDYMARSSLITNLAGGSYTTVTLAVSEGDLDGFTLAANEITIKNAGLYTITLTTTFQGLTIAGGANGKAFYGNTQIDLDQGGGYGLVAYFWVDATITAPVSTTITDSATASKTMQLRLEAGDKIRVRGIGGTGAVLDAQNTQVVIRN